MPTIRNIDIRGIEWPICILNCKKEVDQMRTGERIDVFVDDIDVVNNLITLLKQISGYSIEKQQTNQHYRLIIKKNGKTI